MLDAIHFFELVLYVETNCFFRLSADGFHVEGFCPEMPSPEVLLSNGGVFLEELNGRDRFDGLHNVRGAMPREGFEHHMNVIGWNFQLCHFHIVIVGCLPDDVFQIGAVGFHEDVMSVFWNPDEVIMEMKDVMSIVSEFHRMDSLAHEGLRYPSTGASSRVFRYAGINFF